MLNKIRKMLKQQEGFTLMELMIVVVIIGILAGIAVPIYNGVQDKAKKSVGEANATMLNRAMEQLKVLNNLTEFNGDNPADHEELMKFIGYTNREDELKYVKWDDTKYKETGTPYNEGGLTVPTSDE